MSVHATDIKLICTESFKDLDGSTCIPEGCSWFANTLGDPIDHPETRIMLGISTKAPDFKLPRLKYSWKELRGIMQHGTLSTEDGSTVNTKSVNWSIDPLGKPFDSEGVVVLDGSMWVYSRDYPSKGSGSVGE